MLDGRGKKKKRGSLENSDGGLPKRPSWNDSEAFSRRPIDSAKVNENW
jgi:hypothetical protein